MKNIFFFFFLSIILFSCSRDNEDEITQNNEPLITKMSSVVLYPGYPSYDNAELSFNFQYDSNNRLIKKNGGFLPASGSTGLNGYFTDKIYTALVYDKKKVTVEDFSSSPNFTVLKNSKYYTLDNNQITQKEIPSNTYGNYWDEKKMYKYINNQLSEIQTTLPNMPYDSTDPFDYIETYIENFYYDSKGNLSKSEYILQNNGVNTKQKTVRIFENYDNSYNPWKRFTLLDEYFYRSISINNFRKYTEIKYDFAGNITSNKEHIWGFNYDSSGNIIIN